MLVRRLSIGLLSAVPALAWACSSQPNGVASNTIPASPNVEEVQSDGTVGPFADAPDPIEPVFPDDTDTFTDADYAAEDAKTDAQDDADATAALGAEDDFTNVDLPYDTDIGDAGPTGFSTPSHSAVSCHKRIYVAFGAYSYMAFGAILWRQNPPYSCWYPIDIPPNPDWRACWYNRPDKHTGGSHWCYDDTNPAHVRSTEASRVRGCARSAPAFGFEFMANRRGWRLVQARHLSAFLAELYTTDNDVDNLWYTRSLFRTNTKLKRHRAAPVVNVGANDNVLHIMREVYKVCRKVHNRGYLSLYTDEHVLPNGKTEDGQLVPYTKGKSWSQQPIDAKRFALVVKALDRCTKRGIFNDNCFGHPGACPASEVCAWNGKSYCCRTPGSGATSCTWDGDCAAGQVCATNGSGYFCMHPLCGKTTSP